MNDYCFATPPYEHYSRPRSNFYAEQRCVRVSAEIIRAFAQVTNHSVMWVDGESCFSCALFGPVYMTTSLALLDPTCFADQLFIFSRIVVETVAARFGNMSSFPVIPSKPNRRQNEEFVSATWKCLGVRLRDQRQNSRTQKAKHNQGNIHTTLTRNHTLLAELRRICCRCRYIRWASG